MGGNSDSIDADRVSDTPQREEDLFGNFEEQDGGPMSSAPRKPGRPKGSPNRRTNDLVKFINANHRDPLIGLVEIANMDTRELARHLNCKTLDALKAQLSAVSVVAPYLHQKQPQAIAVTGAIVAPFSIHLPPVETTALESQDRLQNLVNSSTYEDETDIVGAVAVGGDS